MSEREIMTISEREIALIHAALKFFVWGAGEGLSPPLQDHTPEPETTLFEYAVATGDEDWEGLPDKIAAALPLIVAGEREKAAKVAEADADWTRFGKAALEPWENGKDDARDYRLGIVAGRAIAAAIRADKGGET